VVEADLVDEHALGLHPEQAREAALERDRDVAQPDRAMARVEERPRDDPDRVREVHDPRVRCCASCDALGPCNVAITFQRHVAGLLGVEPEHVLVDQVGLNHLSWVRAVRVDGRDVLPELLAEHGDELARDAGVSRRLLEELHAVPSYYLHYYYAHDRVLAEQLDGVPRAATVAEIERELLELYRDPSLVEKPALLERRGGAFYSEAAIGLVGAIAADTGDVHVVDVRNAGTIAELADDDVIEVPARVDRNGAAPLPQPPVAPELLGLIQHVTAYERLALEAARSGDPVVVRKALLAHPLIGQEAPAEDLADRLLEAGAKHLPQFRASETVA